MKILSILFLVVGIVSLLIGIYSRFSMQLIPLAPCGLNASAFISFANTCFLLAIISKLFEKK